MAPIHENADNADGKKNRAQHQIVGKREAHRSLGSAGILTSDSRSAGRNLPVAAFVGVVIVIEMALVLFSMFSRVYQADAPTMPPDFSNTAALGKLMFTDYIYPLEIAAAILLVAMVAAIALTLRSRKDAKHQNPADQVRVRP
ncbi:MAG: hypothetical protein EBX64_10130, partial [Betaproteobacteria bacterium]|nr:hypothetical protein [Betaproteobacteria bacterium]